MAVGSIWKISALVLCGALGACAEEKASVFPPAPDAAKPAAAGDAGTGVATDSGAKADGGTKSDGGTPTAMANGKREQDSRTFVIDAGTLPFEALADSGVETDRWTGVIDGAGYRIEVPKTGWNGKLVMYAHGYAGMGQDLRVTTPSIRRHLISKNYAWAASSYSKNYYDVRVGVEDTNKLANSFVAIATANGRTLAAPTKKFIIGHSMGGHITGAAIEKEAQETAKNKVHYDGAVPMCGVMGDTELFEYFAAYQAAAHQLAEIPVPENITPAAYAPMAAAVQAKLFTAFPTMAMPVPVMTTPLGDTLRTVVSYLTGGPRPMFAQGFASGIQTTVWGTFGGDGTINGILTANVSNTTDVKFQLDDDTATESAEEKTFNADVYRSKGDASANAKRSDGLRWIPVVNAEFDIPVVSLHTLGDLYVPFRMQQIYHERAEAKGTLDKLVQRVVRGTGHCEFTQAEQIAAFEAMTAWEAGGAKPEGDDVMDPAVIAADDYGCKFTDNTPFPDDAPTTLATRAAGPPCQ